MKSSKVIAVIAFILILVGAITLVYINLRPTVYVYRSKDFGISITIPEQWKIVIKDDFPQRKALAEGGHQENYRLIVALKDVSNKEMSPKIMLGAAKYFDNDGSKKSFDTTFATVSFAQHYMDNLKKNMEVTIIKEPRIILLDGVWAITFVGDFAKNKQIYTAIIHNDIAYVLQCIVSSIQDLEANRAVFDKVLKSIRFDKKR